MSLVGINKMGKRGSLRPLYQMEDRYAPEEGKQVVKGKCVGFCNDVHGAGQGLAKGEKGIKGD